MSCYRVPGAVPPEDVVESVEHLHLQPLPRVVGQARGFIKANLPGAVDDVLETALLLTSELVTNAVIHARTDIEVGITITDRSVLVTVHDEDLGRPPMSYPGRDGGRGLGLVEALSEATATERHPGEGKTVWFRLARGGPGEDA